MNKYMDKVKVGMDSYGIELKCGSVLQGGKYVIEEKLGDGGFGITYKGLQVGLDRSVAIKEFFMKEYCERDSGTSHVTAGSQGSRAIVDRFLAKFIKEAQTIAKLDNPHVIRIYDIFEENGTAYYVMEYISGGSLEQYVKGRRRLDEPEALNFMNQIADALTYIHGKNILHLDVKPSNVLLRESGEAVLIDFGISKRYDESGEQSSTTPVAISKGYAPIEQYNQGGVSHFDPSTDVYSLGAVLYKLLTGSRPEEASVLISEGLTIPLHVSARCSGVIRKAMSVRKSDRYQSAAEMKAALSAGEASDEVTIINTEEEKHVEFINTEDDGRMSKSLFYYAACVIIIVVAFVAVCYELSTEYNSSFTDYSGMINGHEYVDLGLSVKWATCNVGASSPTDYGNYYAWGETTTKNEYTKDNSKTYGKSMGTIGGNSSYDAARANWGGSWRLPTKAEFKELIDNCESEWTTQGGINGRRFTSKKNGKSIFLPAAGWRSGSWLYYADERGNYWSSTHYDTGSAYVLWLRDSLRSVDWSGSDYGRSVRPVSE